MRRSVLVTIFTGLVVALFTLRDTRTSAQSPGAKFAFPLTPNSVRFAVIGDSGTGERAQYEVGAQMERFRASFPFEFVIMLGDNIYGSKSEAAFKRKFEDPYRPLLGAGLKFYASLGNHDDPNERFYKPFNMGAALLQLPNP